MEIIVGQVHSFFPLIVALVIGYYCGSIPFGLLIGKWSGVGDIRKSGSGNFGATNMLRVGGKKLAAITLLCDALKGVVAVLFCAWVWDDQAGLVAGFGAVLGHMFPIWLKFKGGKGVATTLGVLLAAVPIVGVITCAIWLVTAKSSKISSLSALVATALAPVFGFALTLGDGRTAGILFLITVLVWIKHHQNIKRLMKNEEPKIGEKK